MRFDRPAARIAITGKDTTMLAGTGASGRTELLLVLAIAAAGVAVAAAITLAPWHPSNSRRHPETSTVIELRSPGHHHHPAREVRRTVDER
ncbi:hypothetical protein [Actinocatenispora sera]|uniref:Uncharacterized protein n=1 Tax=Actinocatenispora sera TaxID=390989 RepID=A0A810L0C6_9ACTN|nr:hypothetical protein [Actinocatenispora sera]BCJ28873.1 hypothetical protein Asera_29810 [Actinocatenispora sera]